MSSEIEEIYQEVILGHNKRPRNARLLEQPTGRAHGHNPLCGDEVTVTVRLKEDRVQEIGFEAQACAVCTASASLMTLDLAGKPVGEALERMQTLVTLLKGPADAAMEMETWGDAAALGGVRKFPLRIKCATLPWHTFAAALQPGRGGEATEVSVE